MAPKIDRPEASSISMRTRSPKRRNGVSALPRSIVSIMRRSARQDEPAAGSRLETVPEPMIVPASSARVRAAWAIRVGKSKFMSRPASGRPSSTPFTRLSSGKWMVRPSQAGPSSSGVAATGEKAVAGFEVDAPPLVGDENVIAGADEAVRAALIHQGIAVEALRHLRLPRLADELGVMEVGRAVGPLIGARQRRRRFQRIEGEAARLAPHVQPLRDCGERLGAALPIVERRLQRRRDSGNGNRAREIAADDDERAVPAARLERGELHRAASGARQLSA